MKRLLSFDPVTGIETWHEYDHAEKQTRIYYVPTRDVDPTLSTLKRMANDDELTKRGIKNEWWLYGHIPDAVLLKWYVEEGIHPDDTDAMFKKLNDPDYKYLKATHKYHA